jgi:class 3 adenylate cyclase/tetratricopeptide (TPR) repeat protein
MRAEHRGAQALHEGERRHLTVLFCDLVGSTGIASHLDPEQWREIVSEYHRTAAHSIERYGGRVAQYLGDGVMAYFGYPEAHDNDAERAARAGLAILDAIAKVNNQPGRLKLAARVGIDSGAVVVGAGAGTEADVFGNTPNIAARVQAAAEPGTVAITDAAHRLVSGLFVVEDRGAHSLKGIEKPIQVYRVVRPSGVLGRLQAVAQSHGLSSFVGRENELRLLMSCWERAVAGEGQVVLIIGEPGIGKSRLVQRFHEQIAGKPHSWVEAAAGPFFQNTPFHSVADIIRELLAWRGDEAKEEQLNQLERALESMAFKPAEALPLIAPLLNLATQAKYPPSSLSPEEQRRRLLATLVEWVLGVAQKRPTIVAIEDLHWVDPSTLELIQLLVERGATARLLLLFTARPEFHAKWLERDSHTQITLDRLSARNVRAMVKEITARKALPDEMIAAVVERTDGVPLFIEELTRTLLEADGAELRPREIPATLHDSLLARLDRLGSAKDVAQFGAVIGREFSYALLHAVHPAPDSHLQVALEALSNAELLYVRGIPPESVYGFRHALIQDAAYETLLRTRRREIHRHVANVISQRSPDIAEAQPEILAHHYTEAGLAAEAVPYWVRAGEGMSRRSAHIEAIRHLTKGLQLLHTLPENRERAQQELALQMAMGASKLATSGLATPETGQAYSRARELCSQLGESSQLFRALLGLRFYYTALGELQAARELGEQMLQLAQGAADTELIVEANYALSVPLHFLGEFVSARAHLEQSIELYDPDRHRDHAVRYGQDPGVVARALLGWLLWELGYPDRALEKTREALSLARGLSHPFTLAYALILSSTILLWRRDSGAVIELTDDLIPLCREQGFSSVLTSGTLVRDGALIAQGKEEEIAMKPWEPAWLRITGSQSYVTGHLARSVDAHVKTGDVDAGMRLLAEAIARAESTEERYCEAELYRLKGELLRKHHSDAEAEQSFRTAIRIAQGQSAKSFQLRATMSLAALLRDRGRQEDAHVMLVDIYNWFTEGFSTADLKDARALLDELAN